MGFEQFYENSEAQAVPPEKSEKLTEEEWKQRILKKQMEIAEDEARLQQKRRELQEMKARVGLKHWVPPHGGNARTH